MQLDAEVWSLAQFVFKYHSDLLVTFFFLGIITVAYCTFPNIRKKVVLTKILKKF